MAENSPVAARRPRPLSPHLTHYHWPITMATSITHRATGLALASGTLLLAWWLIATASGPEAFETFNQIAATPLGQVVLFGFVWSLAYHLLAGIRYLFWDLGYGFSLGVANAASVFILLFSVLIAIGAFVLVYLGKGGYFA
jgi:succinate dehydrogenase / fumarate reductase cytochrome b subunit